MVEVQETCLPGVCRGSSKCSGPRPSSMDTTSAGAAIWQHAGTPAAVVRPARAACSEGHQQRGGCTFINPVQQDALCASNPEGWFHAAHVSSCCSRSPCDGQQLMVSTCSSLLLRLLLLGALLGVDPVTGSSRDARGLAQSSSNSSSRFTCELCMCRSWRVHAQAVYWSIPVPTQCLRM